MNQTTYYNHAAKEAFAKENIEKPERQKLKRDEEFRTPEEYIKYKFKMFREMLITPTADEVNHLYSLNDMDDIDRACHTIIERHWS